MYLVTQLLVDPVIDWGVSVNRNVDVEGKQK